MTTNNDLLINEKLKRSKCLVLRPGARKNLSVIKSHTTDTLKSFVQDNDYVICLNIKFYFSLANIFLSLISSK